MSDLFIPTDHEHFQIQAGRRSGLPVMIAVHSTRLGPAIGGLRIKPYDQASDGIADCLRLSHAMTMKAAAVNNGSGGGKAVVPLPMDLTMTDDFREAVLLDVADQVHQLDGAYVVAPDVGTGPNDIDVIYRRTPFVGGRSKAAGGAGGTTFGTFIGVESAIRAAIKHSLRMDSVAGLTFCIIGLGGIGTLLAETLAREGAHLILSDIDESKRTIAATLKAEWLGPDQALHARCDVLVPCALGGLLTLDNIGSLSCRIICGAANNLLATDTVAYGLTERGIVFVPDFIANAGGLMYASGIEFHHRPEEMAGEHVRDSISKNVQFVLDLAALSKMTTQEAALQIAKDRLANQAISATGSR
ncbi:Glu/Leu/Phe/Val dehydrogenase dimerization domain-containing protein [Variovorax sp. GT1P44]|uniref:Glu/Leu/Phe/Val dehydrogenase dimerization domain-containing protein n=1 Tax=Variovorax sp. GT1P44 TaxID=3443742 RepID=UPI003F47F9CE